MIGNVLWNLAVGGVLAVGLVVAMLSLIQLGAVVRSAVGDLLRWLRSDPYEPEVDRCYPSMRDGTCWYARLDECEAADCCAECRRRYGV